MTLLANSSELCGGTTKLGAQRKADNSKAKDEECHISNSNADSDTEPGDELKVTDPVEAANEIFEHSMETAKSNYTIEMGSKLTAEMKAAFLMIGKSMHSLGLQTGGTEENDINKS